MLLMYILGEHLYTVGHGLWVGFLGCRMAIGSKLEDLQTGHPDQANTPINWCSRIPRVSKSLLLNTLTKVMLNVIIPDYKWEKSSSFYPLVCYEGLIHRGHWINALIWRLLYTGHMCFHRNTVEAFHCF